MDYRPERSWQPWFADRVGHVPRPIMGFREERSPFLPISERQRTKEREAIRGYFYGE